MNEKGRKENTINVCRRKFLVSLTSLIGVIGTAFAAFPFIGSWLPSARAYAAGAPVNVDISRLEAGEMMTAKWRGRPVWIVRRTQAMLANLAEHDHLLRDPYSTEDQQPHYASNPHRSVKPEYLIISGVCTHLGCTPTYIPEAGELGSEWPGGFYCPCHGSKFDLAGRVFKGVPAPINLEIPQHKFINTNTVLIGEDESNA